ncbi:MAG: CopG family transcriptional regulator [Angustibacter sp.]
MSARTQVYLTDHQRRLIDEVTAREGVTLAEVVRRAVDRYLGEVGADPTAALAATFGADPDIVVPARDEWHRG